MHTTRKQVLRQTCQQLPMCATMRTILATPWNSRDDQNATVAETQLCSMCMQMLCSQPFAPMIGRISAVLTYTQHCLRNDAVERQSAFVFNCRHRRPAILRFMMLPTACVAVACCMKYLAPQPSCQLRNMHIEYPY